MWLLFASFGLLATGLAPIVRLVEGDLNISHGAMGSIMGAWQLTYIASAIPCGILLDHRIEVGADARCIGYRRVRPGTRTRT